MIKSTSSENKHSEMKANTKQEVISIIEQNSSQFSKYGVTSVGLFGSFVREEATEQSDVDLLIGLENYTWDNYCALLDFVESLFGRKVDVITESSLNPNNGRQICREVEYVFDQTSRETLSHS